MWCIALIFILAFANQSSADDWIDHVTFNEPRPPGSTIIKYGGLEGLVRDECQKQLFNLWTSHNKTLYQLEVIDFDEYKALNEQVQIAFISVDSAGLWWERRWYESIGPPTCPAIYYVGPQDNFLDLGFIKVNSKFKVKLEEYKVELYSRERENRWDLKIRPSLSVGSRDIFQQAEIRFVWCYLRREKKWVDFQIAAGYRQRDGFYIAFSLTLPMWE